MQRTLVVVDDLRAVALPEPVVPSLVTPSLSGLAFFVVNAGGRDTLIICLWDDVSIRTQFKRGEFTDLCSHGSRGLMMIDTLLIGR